MKKRKKMKVRRKEIKENRTEIWKEEENKVRKQGNERK